MLRNESGGEWRVADKRGLRMRVSSGEQHEIRRKLRLSGDWDGRLRERVWGGVCAATAGAGFAAANSSFAAASSSFAATTVHTGIAAAKRSNAASASSGASASRHD